MEFRPLPIEQGNTALLMFQPQWDNGEAVDPNIVTGLTVKTGKNGTLTTISHTIVGTEVAILLAANQELGTYDIRIEGTVGTYAKRNTVKAVYTRTANSGGLHSQVTYHLPWVWVGSSDAEMDAAMQNLNTATAAATAAKAAADAEKTAYAQKVAALDGLAKKTDLPTDYSKEATVTGWINGAWAGFKTWIEGIVGTPKSGATYSTLFGAIEANAGGGGGGSLPAEAAEEIEFTAKALGYTGDMPGYAELTETECGTMVDTLAGQMMHADEDGEVDYLYALQMGYPDHTFTSAEMATIKAARDEYWEEHPIQ